jgi:SpoIID/LytB domain protein
MIRRARCYRRAVRFARLAAVVLVVLVASAACTSAGSNGASPHASAPTPSAGSGSSSSPPGEASTVRVIAPHRGGSLLVRGSYPHVESSCKRFHQPHLQARYPGLLTVKRASDGTLSLTVTLPFEQYLEGIAEMPPSWPIAALQAQAVAARSYALASTGWSGQEGERLDTPICATSSCQVYGGLPVGAAGPEKRWWRAVRQTRGEVLLYGGSPADTVYFSTSNGHTYGNEDVFGSSPLPYLRPVVERDDGASSVSRWSVTIRYDDLASFLARAGRWPDGVPISAATLAGDVVKVSGGGQTRSIGVGDFRDAVNAEAPCLEPGRYPGSLPSTIPSIWLSMSSGANAVTVTGRGWGHGVGMVQWGAFGKARLGWSADRILAYYYGGLRPEPYPEPGLIHVRVADGLSTLRLTPSAPGAKVNGERVGTGPIVIGENELLAGSP